MLTARF
jgi:CDP-diacylglycerol--serine O-phosphatidyltransferase